MNLDRPAANLVNVQVSFLLPKAALVLNRSRGYLENFDYPINSGRVSSDLTVARSRSTRPGWPPQLPAGRKQVHAYRQIFLSLSIDIAAHGETDT